MSGPVAGGTTVAIKGSGFVTGATVEIGGVAATGVVIGGPTTLTTVTGAHATGLADVTVDRRTGGVSATNRSTGAAHLVLDVTGYFE